MYKKEGYSLRAIMKRTGCHYETVSKYLDMEDFDLPIYKTDKKPSRLGQLKPVIDQWLEDDVEGQRYTGLKSAMAAGSPRSCMAEAQSTFHAHMNGQIEALGRI
ncbi:MAG: hypothetical protein LLF78_02135 [Synergistaceae bacterium]|nr:hypothetical protein [Synergistaceae bacterium]